MGRQANLDHSGHASRKRVQQGVLTNSDAASTARRWHTPAT